MSSGRCAHCQTSLTIAQREAGDDYCCTGCEVARHVLSGLVDARRFDALGGAPARVSEARVDEDALARIAAALPAHGRAHVALDVEGVTCASCTWLVENVAKKSPGVRGAVLQTALGRLALDVDVSAFDLPALARTLAQLGHAVGPAVRERDAVADEIVARLGVTAALASAAMVFAFSFYFGLSETDEIGRVFSWGQIIAGGLAVVVGGQPFLRAARHALAARALTMDVPIALGMILAFTASLASVWVGAGSAVYFDTVAVFVTLMLLGRLLERHVVERNRRLLLARDADVAGLTVRRENDDGTSAHVPVVALKVGDVIVVAPGELVPVDGVLLGAPSDSAAAIRRVSRAWITGEPDALEERAGALLAAGSHNADVRALSMRVTAAFQSSRLASLLAPPSARGPDAFFVRLARVWVIGVLVLAAAATALWWSDGPLAVLGVLAPLLVVTCPCAFGIAAPLAIERALAVLRHSGVFIKNPTLLARARQLRTVVFDKTGTLTSGALELCDRSPLAALDDRARAVLAALTKASNHPKSRALAAHLERVRPAPLDVVEEPGVGVASADGRCALRKRGADEATVLVIDGVERAAFSFREELRPGAADEMRRLTELGLTLYIASGDDPVRTQAMAARLGIPAERAWGGLLPEQKRDRVRALDHGDLLYVGDGLNDALAFEAASCAGTPAVDRPQLPARADFFLLGGTLAALADLVVVARRLRATLVGLLATATVYNAVVISFALAGALTPLAVALVMPAMSLSLVTAALLAVRAPSRDAPQAALVPVSPEVLA